MRSLMGMLLSDSLDDDSNIQGKRMLSWRAMTVWKNAPTPVRPHFDLPWNSRENLILAKSCPPWLCDNGNQNTRIVAVRGDDTAYDASIGRFITDTTDSEDAIVLVEVLSDFLVWTRPGDIWIGTNDVPTEIVNIPVSTMMSQGRDYFVAFSDGAVWLMSRDTPVDVLRPFLTISGSKEFKREVSLRLYRKG